MTSPQRTAAVVLAVLAGTAMLAATGLPAAGAISRVEAPETLAATGLYLPGPAGVVDPANRPFAPQYPLWSDGAAKARWVYLPEGRTIDASDVAAWDFPTGTKFWKEFTFGGRRVETRFLWKATPGHWVFASYLWNADGTAAIRAPDAGAPGVAEIVPGKRHAIPSVTECRACHDAGRTEILGFNVLQLSTDRDPNAIHGEPLTRDMVTLATLSAEGRLAPARPDLLARPPRIDAATPEERAVLGYLAANCGGCHNRRGDLAPLGLHWQAAELMAGGREMARAMAAGHRTKWQAPGTPDGESLLVDPASPDQSVLLRRMRSRGPASQMPPLGTVIRDTRAVEAMSGWVAAGAAGSPRPARGAPYGR